MEPGSKQNVTFHSAVIHCTLSQVIEMTEGHTTFFLSKDLAIFSNFEAQINKDKLTFTYVYQVHHILLETRV